MLAVLLHNLLREERLPIGLQESKHQLRAEVQSLDASPRSPAQEVGESAEGRGGHMRVARLGPPSEARLRAVGLVADPHIVECFSEFILEFF